MKSIYITRHILSHNNIFVVTPFPPLSVVSRFLSKNNLPVNTQHNINTATAAACAAQNSIAASVTVEVAVRKRDRERM